MWELPARLSTNEWVMWNILLISFNNCNVSLALPVLPTTHPHSSPSTTFPSWRYLVINNYLKATDWLNIIAFITGLNYKNYIDHGSLQVKVSYPVNSSNWSGSLLSLLGAAGSLPVVIVMIVNNCNVNNYNSTFLLWHHLTGRDLN